MLCKICGFNMLRKGSGSHLRNKHNLSNKEYYDKYLKEKNEGFCKLNTCKKETKFINIYKGYQDHCCNSHAQLDIITRQKIQKTCLKKYGVLSSNQANIVKLKIKQTMINRYGVDNCQKCEKISKKAIKSRQKHNLEKYGVTETSKLSEIKSKISNSTRKYMLNRTQTEKDDFYRKIREIKRKNHTLKTSQPEEDFYSWLLTKFNKNDIYRNYSFDPRYPFACDFYIKSLDTFIELNLYWMHGFHWFDKNNKKDIIKLEKWKSKAKIGHKQYKAAIKVWSYSDLLKRDTAIKNNLNYIVLWNNEDIINFKNNWNGN